MTFYTDTLKRLIAAGKLDPAASTLVIAGGQYDRECLLEAGFTDVTISNLDVRMTPDEFAPFNWSFQDAEALEFDAGSFDQVIEHAGLHHCRSPHAALLEMYRVARKAVLVFENRDSFLMRLAVKLRLTHYYEIEAVADNGGTFGGVRNTGVPNYVYRWTEREVKKVLSSHAPQGPVSISYFYGLRLPEQRLAMYRNPMRRLAASALAIPVKIVSALFPKQSNEFAFFVEKTEATWPWISPETGILGDDWTVRTFKDASGSCP